MNGTNTISIKTERRLLDLLPFLFIHVPASVDQPSACDASIVVGAVVGLERFDRLRRQPVLRAVQDERVSRINIVVSDLIVCVDDIKSERRLGAFYKRFVKLDIHSGPNNSRTGFVGLPYALNDSLLHHMSDARFASTGTSVALHSSFCNE
jgi:hypothetical protein